MRCASILDAIGCTPLVRLNRLANESDAAVWVKLESLNPSGSANDRPALNLVIQALRDGRLVDGGSIVEASYDSLGIALSMIGAALGCPVKIMVDPLVSQYNVKLIKAYGAELMLVEDRNGCGEYEIPRIGAAESARAIAESSFIPSQWANPADLAARTSDSSTEILADLDGEIDAVVCATSDHGHLWEIGRTIGRIRPSCLIVAAGVQVSAAISGLLSDRLPFELNSRFTPDIIDESVIDHVYSCTDVDALNTCRLLASEEGMLLGGWSGAAVFIAMRVAQRLGAGANVVAIAPDSRAHCMDTIYDDSWWQAKRIQRYHTVAQLRDRLDRYEPVVKNEAKNHLSS